MKLKEPKLIENPIKVEDSVEDSVWDSVMDSVRYSVEVFMGNYKL